MIKKKTKAQSIIEYVILLVVIGAALSAMQLYFRRGIQAAVKLAADEVGNQADGVAETDYSSLWRSGAFSKKSTGKEGEKKTILLKNGAVSYTINETNRESGVIAYDMQEQE